MLWYPVRNILCDKEVYKVTDIQHEGRQHEENNRSRRKVGV